MSTIDSPQTESHRRGREAQRLKYSIAAIEVFRWGSRLDWSPIDRARCTFLLEYFRLAPFRAIIDAFSVLCRHATVPIQAIRAVGVP